MSDKNLQILAKVYDPKARVLIRNKDSVMLELFNITASGEIDVKVVTSTKDITYVALPALERDIDIEQLDAVGAKGCTSSAGSIASLSTLGTICGTASTGTTAGTVGSAGSVDT